MAICVDDYCLDPLNSHTDNDCDEYKYGGVSQVVAFKCLPNNPSSGAEVLNMIAAGTAWIIPGLLGGIPEGSPVEIDAQESCGDSQVARIDRTLTFSDSAVNANNVEFYNRARRRQFASAIAYFCDSGESVYILPKSSIKLRGTQTAPNQNNDTRKFVGEFYWNNLNDPLIIPTPDGVFA